MDAVEPCGEGLPFGSGESAAAGRSRGRLQGQWGTDAVELGGEERPFGSGEIAGEVEARSRSRTSSFIMISG